jgi:hypothetical protein
MVAAALAGARTCSTVSGLEVPLVTSAQHVSAVRENATIHANEKAMLLSP